MLPDIRVRQRDYLLEIAKALTQELDLNKLLGRILNIAIDILAGKAGLIALKSPAKGWQINVSSGLAPAFLNYVQPFLTDLPTTSENAIKNEIPEINRLLTDLVSATSMGSLTGVGLPLVAREQVVGVIFIFRAYQSVFSLNDRLLLGSFADQAAIAVQNAQLYSLVSDEKKRLDALLDSVADGIFILTSDHKVEHCNPAFSQIIGIPQDQILQSKHDELITWMRTPQGLPLEEAEAGGWPLTPHAHLYVEGDLKRSSTPPYVAVGITYSPLLTSEGVIKNIIASVRDITRFRQADELKSTFISIISHELKTPVALIKGYVSTLRREDVKWEKEVVQDSLQVIEEEADHLTGLIENLLDASRLQAGGIKINQSDVNLVELTQRIAERMGVQAERHQIVVDFPPDFPVIIGDEQRLRQVLNNLVANAIKYTPEGKIIITGSVKPDSVMVCVSDQGPGIASADIPHVFDRFYRAPDMARNTKGAGLGLYLTKAIIEAHGGSIWINPEKDKGAQICFTLPR